MEKSEGVKMAKREIMMFAFILASLAFVNVGCASAITHTCTVDDDSGADFIKIQDAISAASDGDTILVFPGIYSENVVVDKSLTLMGIEHPIVAASENASAITLKADKISLLGFNITSGVSNIQGGIMINSSDDCTILYNNISNFYGVIVGNTTSNTKIVNNYLSNNEFGIGLVNSGSNYIIGNNAKDNGLWGIGLLDYSNSNTITGNNINDNTAGVYLFKYSNSNTITGNNINNNGIWGIWLNDSNSNTITGNNINNNLCGVSSENAIDNKIYLNNFRDSFFNVKSDNSTDFWYLTEKITYTYNGRICSHYLGNYWSDYKGTDADGDGIGDSPYPIDVDNDNYPLMEPFENYKIEHPHLAILASTKASCDQYKTGKNRDAYGYNELLEIQKIIDKFNKSFFER